MGRREEPLVNLANEIESFGGKAGCYCMDITDFNNVQNHVESIFARFIKVDVLVNNAGLTSKIKKESFEYTASEWDDIFNTNVKAAWVLTNSIVKKMISLNIHGSIINISSSVSVRPRHKDVIYGTSKGAVVALTKILAIDYAKYNIRINAIAPGVFEVDRTRNYIQSAAGQELVQNRIPMQKAGNSNDLDGPLLLLASDASKYMTGECIHVDGGLVTGAIM